MPNPLNKIIPILNLIGSGVKILPATGGAVEELLHPDQHELDDILLNKGDDTITEFAETPSPDIKNIYRSTPYLPRKENHFYHYFIDGSLRTYFLATGIEGKRSFPIELAQIGSTVIQRDDEGQLSVLAHKQRIILLLPKENQGISDTLWNKIKKIDKPEFLEIIDYSIPDKFSKKKEDQDPRDKAGAKARSEMHRLEIDLIKSTDNLRNENSWLILDGAVKFTEGDVWNSWKKTPYIIGVAKSFRKDPEFLLGQRHTQRKDITNILAHLPHEHRTTAFWSYDKKVAFWYVRLREQKELDYPLMGVVKVEVPRPDQTTIESELADLISRTLVAERNVTPYGNYSRWHCSLYPIYIAEQVIKNRFYSKEVLMGCIKWPKPMMED